MLVSIDALLIFLPDTSDFLACQILKEIPNLVWSCLLIIFEILFSWVCAIP